MICMAEEEQAPTYAEVAAAASTNTPNPDKDKTQDETNTGELDAVKGGKKGNGKGKGYGQCWHCGQMGHPRRECPEWLKLQGGNVAALKGGEGYNGKGKGKKGKGKKGQGTGKGWWNYGKAAGKAAGTSLN